MKSTADAFQATCVSFEGEKRVESLYHLFWGETEAEQSISTYSRYWHGYQVLLCPLLALFSYPTIRSLNVLLETAAVMLLLYLLVRRGMDLLCLPFLVMWMCLSPATLFNSLQYSAVFYSMMGACIVLVWRHDELDAMSRSAVFTVCGVLVAYLDLLTYPLVALGVPLILYLSLDSSRDLTLGQRAGQVLLYSAAWCIGYGGMWASKWVITSLVTGELVIAVYGAVSMLYVLLQERAGPPASVPPVEDGRAHSARGAHVVASLGAGAGDGSVESPAGRHLRSSSAHKK